MRKLVTGLSRVVRAELGRWLRCVPEVELRTWLRQKLRWHDGQDDETAREPRARRTGEDMRQHGRSLARPAPTATQ